MPFDFLSLPQEVQDFIYRDCIHYRTMMVTCSYGNFERYKIYFPGIPSLNIELVCRKFSRDVGELRSRLWPQTLHINSETMPPGLIAILGTHEKYKWLHGHVQHVSTRKPGFFGRGRVFNFNKLTLVTITGIGDWVVHDEKPSVRTVRRIYMNDAMFMDYALRHRDYFEKMSGGRAEQVDLTLVGEVRAMRPYAAVQVHMTYRCKKEKDQTLRPYLVSTKYTADGKEVSEES